MTKRIRPDESLVDILGTNQLTDADIGGEAQVQVDPIADLIQQAQFGLLPASAREKTHKSLTVDEARQALSAMADQLHTERHERLLRTTYPEMLKRSDELFGSESLSSIFLRAAISKDKKQVEEFVELFKAGPRSEVQ